MKPADLAAITTKLLQDPDACPTAPLTDVACAIADQFEDALAALVARLQATSDAKQTSGIAELIDLASIAETLMISNGDAVAAGRARIRLKLGAINYVSTCAGVGTKSTIYSVEPRRKGWRFAKIIKTAFYNVRMQDDGTETGEPTRRVVGFVEAGTGLMWKAASFKAPALNFPRGCIFTLPDDWECDGSFDTLTAPISLEVK